MFIISLRRSGYEGIIHVLMDKSERKDLLASLMEAITADLGSQDKDHKVVFQEVPTVKFSEVKYMAGSKICKGFERYEKTFTKLNLFNLTQYEQVMYYDSDIIFMNNPEDAFGRCKAAADNICAVADTFISTVYPKVKVGSYFNSG